MNYPIVNSILNASINHYPRPTDNEIKNTIIEAKRWNEHNESIDKNYTWEQGVEAALKWVLGITNENPIDIEYENK